MVFCVYGLSWAAQEGEVEKMAWTYKFKTSLVTKWDCYFFKNTINLEKQIQFKFIWGKISDFF